MKKVTVYMIILLIVLAGVASAEANVPNVEQISEHAIQQGTSGLIQVFENIYRLFMRLSLPKSLDKWFTTQKPEVPGTSDWVQEMFIQAGAFEGIATNLQQGDFTNATVSYNVFADEYKKVSKKVPEWKGYFDLAAVDKLGDDLKAKNVSASFQDIGAIGATCSNCHADRQPQVWAKYYWRDFDTVNVTTAQGNLSWSPAMFALAGAFDGMGANLAFGKQKEANDSFNQYVALYTDIKDACKNCHDTPRYYYVSDDVFAQINQLGQNITAGNLQNASKIQQDLAIQCYKCHVLHMPAQDMKDKMEK